MKEKESVIGMKRVLWFEVEAGLRQGCPLLPVLYCYSDYVLNDLEDKC